MTGAEGESVKWVKTLSLSSPACCSAAMRYTSLQLTHVLWHSVSHTLDSSVDWPWLIAAGLYIKRRKQSDTFYPTNTMKMLPRWLYYKNEHTQCWVIPHAPVCVWDAGWCICVNLYIIMSTPPGACCHVSWQMLPEPSAVSPVIPCPLTFSNVWRHTCQGQCTSLVDYEALPFINTPSGSVIWYLH